jgi:hypothetical protein
MLTPDNAEGKRQKAESKRQKAKGTRQNPKGEAKIAASLRPPPGNKCDSQA